MVNNFSFTPYHTPAVEFAVLDKQHNVVLPSSFNCKLKTMPDNITFGNYLYADGRRFIMYKAVQACLAYVVDAVRLALKVYYEDIAKNKLWIRPIFLTENKEYKEIWDSSKGKETVVSNGVSPLSFYNFPHFYSSYSNFPSEEELIKIVRVWNAYVGIPWVLLDRDPLAKTRAQIIHPAGKFKIIESENKMKSVIFPHVSAAALLSPALVWLIYGLGREAIGLAMTKSIVDPLLKKLPPDDEVSEVINKHSLSGALELWSKEVRNLGINWHNDPYSAVFWEKSLPTFEWLILNGGAFGLGTNAIKNWHLDKTTIGIHCSTLIAWERQVMMLSAAHKTPPLLKSHRNQIQEVSIQKLEEMEKQWTEI